MIAMLIALLCTQLEKSMIGAYADQVLQRSLYSFRSERKPPAEIVVVGIDDETYKALDISPRHPFPRRVFAEGLQKIQNDKPKVAILDLYAPREKEDPEANEQLAKALASGPSVLTKIDVDQAPIEDAGDEENARLTYSSDTQFSEAAATEASLKIATVNGLAYRINAGRTPAAPLEERLPLYGILEKYSGKELELPGWHDFINFYGEAGMLRRVSFADVISDNGKVPEGFFLNNIVFIGFQSNLKERARSDKDIIEIPASSRGMFGVEVHATIAANLLDRSWLRRLAHQPFDVEHFLLLTLSFFLILGIISLKPAQAFVYLLGFLGLWYGVTYLAFAQYYYFIPGVFLMLIVAPLVLAVAGVITALSALKELQETKRMLGVQTAEGAAKSGTWFGK